MSLVVAGAGIGAVMVGEEEEMIEVDLVVIGEMVEVSDVVIEAEEAFSKEEGLTDRTEEVILSGEVAMIDKREEEAVMVVGVVVVVVVDMRMAGGRMIETTGRAGTRRLLESLALSL